MIDGSVDAGKKEDELVVIVYCFRDDNAMEISSRDQYWSVHSPRKASLLFCIADALKFLGIENIEQVLGVEEKPHL